MKNAKANAPAAGSRRCFEALCVTLDRLGIPTGSRWRGLIMFMRSIKDHEVYNAEQKHQVQELVMETFKDRDFTDDKFQEVARRTEEILSAPWRKRLQDSFADLSHMIGETRAMILKRKGQLEVLETSTVDSLQTGKDFETIADDIRRGFHEVVSMMEEDACKLSLLSRTDALTGLGNRRAFDEDLIRIGEQAYAEGKALSLIMVDVDHFKDFNDKFGHLVGDQALAAVSSVIRDCAQHCSNHGQEASAYRFGGEEFVVLVRDMTANQAQGLGEFIRSRIETYNFIIRGLDGRICSTGIGLTVSVGVTSLRGPWGENSGRRLVARADEALYAAKIGGRNQVAAG